MEVISGAPPAEFGEKTSVVINVTTASGQALPRRRAHHDFLWKFWHTDLGINLGYGGQKWGTSFLPTA